MPSGRATTRRASRPRSSFPAPAVRGGSHRLTTCPSGWMTMGTTGAASPPARSGSGALRGQRATPLTRVQKRRKHDGPHRGADLSVRRPLASSARASFRCCAPGMVTISTDHLGRRTITFPSAMLDVARRLFPADDETGAVFELARRLSADHFATIAHIAVRDVEKAVMRAREWVRI